MPKIAVSVNGVQKLLSNLKPDKEAGSDNIKPLVLKELSSQISPLITLLFQKALDSRILPKVWTSANVIPLFKKGNKEDPANYRPISLTCILCKSLEHLIFQLILINITYFMTFSMASEKSVPAKHNFYNSLMTRALNLSNPRPKFGLIPPLKSILFSPFWGKNSP